MFGAAGPMARSAADLDLMLDVLAEPRAGPRSVDRVAVFEERPPRAADLRAAFDVIVAHELVPAIGRVTAGREDELTPYAAQLAEASRDFTPSFDAYLAAFAQIAEIDAEATRWFERCPVALCPVAPDVAPPLGVFAFPPVDGQPLRPGGKLSLCSYANALGLPALALPVMRSSAGLPAGVQVFARRGEERTLTALARRLEPVLGGWIDPDG